MATLGVIVMGEAYLAGVVEDLEVEVVLAGNRWGHRLTGGVTV